MVDINRRGLITGLISLAAAPAIVRASSLMPIKVIDPYGISMRLLTDYKYTDSIIYYDIRLFRSSYRFLEMSIEESNSYLRSLDDNS